MSSAGPSSGQFLFSDHNSLFLYTASLYYCLVFILVLLEPLTVSIYILSSHFSVITDNYLGTGSVLGNSSWGRDWFSWKQTEVESGMQVFWRALLGATSVRKWGSRSGQREKLTHNLVATETSADPTRSSGAEMAPQLSQIDVTEPAFCIPVSVCHWSWAAPQ